ncbi:redoxin domain-containing protein [Spongiibacter tropicus]|uniref:redoxin domain-containing protein n=1 Tax=Spongiibacter tropicus TaxID=454602 RepID=UPI0003B5E24A|nr:redoxin domain-containing protein [Spongiibacter tropicus]
MNLLKALAKRYFVTPYVLLCGAASLHALWQMWVEPGFSLSWFAAWLAVTPVPVFVLLLYLVPFVNTGRFVVIQILAAMIGAALAVVEMHPLPTFYALVPGLAGVLIYVYWYSYLDRDDNPRLTVGQALPAFHLQDRTGEHVDSASFVGRKTLLLFFRGGWCPLCRSQLYEFSSYFDALREYGLHIVLISDQAVDESEKLVGTLPQGVEVYFDSGLQAARTLGLVHPFGVPAGVFAKGPHTSLPSLILSDESGTIRYADLPENFRVGPRPAQLIKVLEQQWL